MPLSDTENCMMGILCGATDCTLLQSTNYWKNASQQGLPFSLDPRVLYRGYTVNVLQNSACVMSQFFINGMLTKAITGGVDRPLSGAEQIAAGVGAGAISSLFAGPMELVMIQQQVKGGGLVSTASNVMKGGASTVFRGTTGMALREGIYSGGYLGIIPVVRGEIQKRYPELSQDQARLAAAFTAGPVCSMLSHPPDTIKTCLQGDIENATYKSYSQTVSRYARGSLASRKRVLVTALTCVRADLRLASAGSPRSVASRRCGRARRGVSSARCAASSSSTR